MSNLFCGTLPIFFKTQSQVEWQRMQNDSNLPKADLQYQLSLLQNRELIGSAYLFIYSHQPLAFIGGQLLHFVSPLLNIVAPNQNWYGWAELLSNATKNELVAKTLHNKN